MAKRKDAAERIVDAALTLAAEHGWADVSLTDIARSARLSLADLHDRFPSKVAILAAYGRRVDAAVLTSDPPFDAEDTPRDRLFELLMLRFEILAQDRAAVTRILDDVPRDPLAALVALPSLVASMGWMLEAAGLSAGGLRGLLRAKALAAVWLATLAIWRQDESHDLARTMAALDRNLRRAEGLMRGIGRRGRRAGVGETEEPPP